MFQFSKHCKACGKEFMPAFSDNPDRDICYSCSPLPMLKIRKRGPRLLWPIVIIVALGLVALLILR